MIKPTNRADGGRVETQLDKNFRNLARGNRSYRMARFSIAREVLAHSEDRLSDLPPFLASELFSLKEADWVNFDFIKDDRKLISRLLQASTAATSDNLLLLATHYIEANQERVENLDRMVRDLSDALLAQDLESITSKLDEFDEVDFQSFVFLRTFCAVLADNHQQLIEAIRSAPLSPFIKRWALYPFVYYVTNTPHEGQIDQFLSYILPESEANQIERLVIRHLLTDSPVSALPFSACAYLALLAHPYDAREMLTHQFELRLSSGLRLTEAQQSYLRRINTATPTLRTKYLVDILDGRQMSYAQIPRSLSINDALNILPQSRAYFVDFINITDLEQPDNLPIVLKHLTNLRSKRYPDVYEYNQVINFTRRYWFTDIGRFVGALLTATYLVPRGNATSECLIQSHLHCYLGAVSPFSISSPRSLTFYGKARVFNFLSLAPEDQAKIDAEMRSAATRADRWWLKGVQWELKGYQRQAKIVDWIQTVRKRIPIAVDYLTGISWEWVDEVIEVVRIAPFRNSTDGIYVLLLRMIEQRQSESNVLRVAIEQIARSSGKFEKFLDQLCRWYGEDVIAFLKYFLTPNTIMRLRLSKTYIGALSMRIRAIEVFVSRYGGNGYFNPDQLKQEQRTFETELMLINVNASQFEINWDIFKKDAQQRLEDVFRAFSAFNDRDSREVLSSARVTRKLGFAAGREINLHFQHNELPKLNLIMAIIDLFLEHPSQGIESILSVRIRHWHFTRQFAEEVDRLRLGGGPHFRHLEKSRRLEQFEDAVTEAVQSWLDRFIHQPRSDKEDGIFDFIPREADIRDLLTIPDETFDEIIDHTIAWLRRRLEDNLRKARASIEVDLIPLLTERISGVADQAMAEEPEKRAQIEHVAGVLSATLRAKSADLSSWFEAKATSQELATSAAGMLMLMKRFYSHDVGQKRLNLSLRNAAQISYLIERGKLRHFFDLCRELINNALRYGLERKAVLTAIPYRDKEAAGLYFVSLCGSGEEWARTIAGDPQIGPAQMFGEGNSGLDKVAALAAAIKGSEVNIEAVRKKRGFVVKVPIIKN